MAERARSRHSNTDLAHNNLHYQYYPRAEDQQQQRSSKSAREKKHYDDAIVVEDYSDDDKVPFDYGVVTHGCGVIVEEEDKMVSHHRHRTHPRIKHNKHSMVSAATAMPNTTITIQQRQQQQNQNNFMPEPMQRKVQDECNGEIPESKSSRSKNNKRSFTEHHYMMVKIYLFTDVL